MGNVFTLEAIGRIIIAVSKRYPVTIVHTEEQKIRWFYIYQLVEQELKELKYFKSITDPSFDASKKEHHQEYLDAVGGLKEVTRFLKLILDWVPVASQIMNVAVILQDYLL